MSPCAVRTPAGTVGLAGELGCTVLSVELKREGELPVVVVTAVVRRGERRLSRVMEHRPKSGMGFDDSDETSQAMLVVEGLEAFFRSELEGLVHTSRGFLFGARQ